MKLCLALLLAPAAAFVPPSLVGAPKTVSFGAYDDAVAEALAATQQYGFTSGEAKTAWSAVEEIKAADGNSAASKPGLDEECDPADPACRTYANSMDELAALIATSKSKSESIKVQLAKFSAAPLPSPSSGSGGESDASKRAVAAAEKASKEFGATSSEAKSAWAVVEELNDSLDQPAAALPGLDQACVTAAIDKCAAFDEAMDSLDKALGSL